MSETYQSVWSNLMGLSFTQGWVTANGVRTRYVRAGDPKKPTVIMLHGIGGSWECFCGNLAAFAGHFDVIAFDMLGSGFSDKPSQAIYTILDYSRHTAAVMDALGIERASFVGVSLGSWIAARFACDYPQRTTKMIACAVSGLTRQTAAATSTGASICDDRMAAVDDPSWERVEHVFAALIHNPAKRLPDFVKVRQAVDEMPAMKLAMRSILAVTEEAAFAQNALVDAEWRQITAPTLLVDATDDSPHFQRNVKRAAALLPHATVVAMKNVGHWAQFEDAETFNHLAIAFLLD